MILDILLRIFSKAHEIIFLSNSITCDEFYLFLFRCFDHISSELKDTPYSVQSWITVRRLFGDFEVSLSVRYL